MAIKKTPIKDLLGFVLMVSRMTADGDTVEGESYVMDTSDAIDTMNRLIHDARRILRGK